MIVKTDCETDGSFYSTTPHLHAAPHKLLLGHVSVVVDIQSGEDGVGSLHGRVHLQALVEVKRPEQLDHLPQLEGQHDHLRLRLHRSGHLDGLRLVLVVHLEDPVQLVRGAAGRRAVSRDDELVEIYPAVLILKYLNGETFRKVQTTKV